MFSKRLNGNSGAASISKRASTNWIMLIYFVSGACSLIDQVVWVRLLKLTLGNTVYASSVVVSVFMGGLALGALIMAKYADRVRGQLRLYGLLEFLITISALSLPLMLRLADKVYIWFYQTNHPSHGQLLAVQVIISTVILLVPSMLMGSTLPLLGRFVTALEKEAGHLVGRLYALNTLGAAIGCFVAGFILIKSFGVMGALYTAAVMNLLVAFGGWFLSRFSGIGVDGNVEAEVESEVSPQKSAAGGRFYLLVIAFFMSGLISIGYELLWMRSIVHVIGGFTYVFSAVLTIYLVGNVIGAGIGSRLAVRLKVPAIGFAVTLSLLGLCGVFFLPVLIFWTSKILPKANEVFDWIYSVVPISSYMLEPFAQSVFLFLVPAIIMGIGFPIALQAWAYHMHKVGKSTGTAYGANTIGAVFGGILTGFLLIPLLGLQISMSALGLAGVWIAGIMVVFFVKKTRFILRFSLLLFAVVITIISVMLPSDMFHTVVRLNPHIPSSYNELLFVKEGITTTVSVHRNPVLNYMELFSSGQSLAGEGSGTRTDQKMLGSLCVLLHDDVQKVLSVGFGSGETTATLAQHEVESIDCVEIAPEVVDVALEYFKHMNLGSRERLDEEINLIFMDAKNYMHLTDVKYDAIVNDSIHPRFFAENSSLYTKEYFETAKERLNEDGILVCWIPTYDMPSSVLNSIYGTMLDVFPYTTLWYPNNYNVAYVWLVGSMQPQMYSPKHIDKVMQREGTQELLSDIELHNSIDLLVNYVGDEKDLRKHITEYAVNSDYSPFVEFTTDRDDPIRATFKEFVTDIRSTSLLDHIDWTGFSEDEKKNWLTEYQKLSEVTGYLLMSYGTDNPFEGFKYMVKGLSILPDNPALIRVLADLEKQLFSDAIKMIVSGNYKEAGSMAGAMFGVNPKSATAWMINSAALNASGDIENSLKAIQRAAKLEPNNPNIRIQLGFVLSRAKQFEKAIIEYKAGLRLKPDQPAILGRLASISIMNKESVFYNPSEAVRFAERACELTGYNNLQNLDTLSSSYAAAGRVSESIDTAEQALDIALREDQAKIVESLRKRLLYFKSIETMK